MPISSVFFYGFVFSARKKRRNIWIFITRQHCVSCQCPVSLSDEHRKQNILPKNPVNAFVSRLENVILPVSGITIWWTSKKNILPKNPVNAFVSRLENVSSLYGQKNLVSTRSIRERRLPATYNPGNAESAFSPLSNLQSFLYDPRFRRNNARQLKHLPPILRTRSLSHAHAPYLTHTPVISSTRQLSHTHARYLTHMDEKHYM